MPQAGGTLNSGTLNLWRMWCPPVMRKRLLRIWNDFNGSTVPLENVTTLSNGYFSYTDIIIIYTDIVQCTCRYIFSGCKQCWANVSTPHHLIGTRRRDDAQYVLSLLSFLSLHYYLIFLYSIFFSSLDWDQQRENAQYLIFYPCYPFQFFLFFKSFYILSFSFHLIETRQRDKAQYLIFSTFLCFFHNIPLKISLQKNCSVFA